MGAAHGRLGMADDAVRGGEDRGGSQCPMCNADLFKRHCKYVCPQHGVVADCADPFRF
jgi:uncharacterized Zn finger protein (UPF0148 family)